MAGLQYSDIYKSRLKRYTEDLDKKMREELEKEKPDITRLNALKQAKYITPIFGDDFGTMERFRNPW